MNKKQIYKIIIICLGIVAVVSTGFFVLYKNNKFVSKNIVLPKLEMINLQLATKAEETPAIKPIENDKLSLLFVGDMMLDRGVMNQAKKNNDYFFPFKNLDYFADYDVRIGNLEGPITTFTSIANGTGGQRLTFTFSPEFLEPLKNYFTVLDLANNHTTNFGTKGLVQTRDFLTKNNLQFFGDPNNDPDNLSTIIEKNNLKIGLVGYHQLVNFGFTDVVKEIKKIRSEVDWLIVMPHWGAEYETKKPTTLQIKEAHQMIEAGADVIVGTHPHVIQPIEEYQNKIIFYSLGNFIFDQYFSVPTMQGLNIVINLEKGDKDQKINFKILPIVINKVSQPSLAPEEVKNEILSSLSKLSNVSTSTKQSILTGEIGVDF